MQTSAEQTTTPKLRPRALVPPFSLPSAAGGSTGPGALRSKYNLVLAFLGPVEHAKDYLAELASANRPILDEQARIMAVVIAQPGEAREAADHLNLPFALLIDSDGSTTARMLGSSRQTAICVADRYGEIYGMDTADTPGDLPTTRSALEWLQYIQSLCPE